MCDCETHEIEIKNERNCCDVCYLCLESYDESDYEYEYDNSFLSRDNNIRAQ